MRLFGETHRLDATRGEVDTGEWEREMARRRKRGANVFMKSEGHEYGYNASRHGGTRSVDIKNVLDVPVKEIRPGRE